MAHHINGALNWEQWGKRGQPLVFIHPNPLDHTCWLYQMAHLQTWFRCIGIDLPGYGRSPGAAPGLTMEDVAAACWEAVDAVSSAPAILVGLSVGSNVLLHMNQQQPERTRAMIHTGCGYRPVKEFALHRRKDYAETGIAYRAQHAPQDFSASFRQSPLGTYFVQMMVERNRWADAPTIAEMFLALSEPDQDELFLSVGCPTLIITGSEDNAHQQAFDLQARIAGCELVTIEGAGHACNMEKPWEWDAAALSFLRSHHLLDEEPR